MQKLIKLKEKKYNRTKTNVGLYLKNFFFYHTSFSRYPRLKYAVNFGSPSIQIN